jgi:hypothetical protein
MTEDEIEAIIWTPHHEWAGDSKLDPKLYTMSLLLLHQGNTL